MELPAPRAYVDVHILQTVPPANLNRDDQGNPKEAVFGGVRRSRVSSQAWKRATRLHFTDHREPDQDQATRTRRVAAALAGRIGDTTGLDDEGAACLATALLAPLKIRAGKKEGDTAYLFFYGHRQLDAVAALVRDRAADLVGLDDKALAAEMEKLPIQEVFTSGHPLDVALFGRMVADIPALRVDAAVQVAHALSTHMVDLEFDYFTAVDDEARKGQETGAGMIGTIGFNSATLYGTLASGCTSSGTTWTPTRTRSRACSRSSPRSPAAHPAVTATPSPTARCPAWWPVVVRSEQPVNLVSAFEEPVPPSSGIAAESARRLAKEHSKALKQWGDPPDHTAVCHAFDESSDTGSAVREAFGDAVAFPRLLTGLGEHLSSLVAPSVPAAR